MKLVSALRGRRCSLCHRGRVKRRWSHFCNDCYDHLTSLERRRDHVRYERFSGRPITDPDPALQASLGNESVIEEISRALESANSRVRESAAFELLRLNNPLAVDPLGICLVKYHSEGALIALKRIGDIRAAEYMYTALNVDDAWWQPRQRRINADLVGGIDGEVAHVSVYPYKEDMIPALRNLGGQKLVVQTFVRLAGDPESRRHDAAADALLRIARDGSAGDPETRNMMIEAVHNLLRENAMQQATASQILKYLGMRGQSPKSA